MKLLSKFIFVISLFFTSPAIAFEWPFFSDSKCDGEVMTKGDAEKILEMNDLLKKQFIELDKERKTSQDLIDENEKLKKKLQDEKDGDSIFETVGKFVLVFGGGILTGILIL